MSTEKIYESVTVDGLQVFHTYRGYNNDIEVYTTQAGDKTYSLYRQPNQTTWQCDWTASYNCQPILLTADPGDKEAMLKAFAAMLRSLQKISGH